MTEEFITKFIQDGRRKPKKFKHFVRLPQELFCDLMELKIIDPERYYIDETAFFQFDGETATVNFQCLYSSEDFYAKVTNYLIVQLMGQNPIQRGGFFE
jgi:hypothetical protein